MEDSANNDVTGDFISPTLLNPGDIHSIQWRDTGLAVSKNGYIMGLSPRLRESLLDYCDYMGIATMMRNLTSKRQQQRPRTDENLKVQLRGFDWFIQRSPSGQHWNSNMHWISPLNSESYNDYLKALGNAGFDEVLEAIGTRFGYRGLVAYHLSFIAVSKCDHGSIHVDATSTGTKAMNIIIPLVLVEGGDHCFPELNLRDDQVVDGQGKRRVGKLRYQHNIAALLGDDVYHGTSSVDYLLVKQGEMRLAATVYVADVSYANVSAILDDHVTYKLSYPPRNDPGVLMSLAGSHWKRDDSTKKLPKSNST